MTPSHPLLVWKMVISISDTPVSSFKLPASSLAYAGLTEQRSHLVIRFGCLCLTSEFSELKKQTYFKWVNGVL